MLQRTMLEQLSFSSWATLRFLFKNIINIYSCQDEHIINLPAWMISFEAERSYVQRPETGSIMALSEINKYLHLANIWIIHQDDISLFIFSCFILIGEFDHRVPYFYFHLIYSNCRELVISVCAAFRHSWSFWFPYKYIWLMIKIISSCLN